MQHRRRLRAAVLALSGLTALALTAGGAAGASPAPRHHHVQAVRDWNVSADGATSVTTASGGAVTAGDTLVTYVEADAPGAGTQTAAVSGCGQTWHLLARQNAQAGDTEAWYVTGAAAKSSCAVTATMGQGGFRLSATAADYGATGTPTAVTGHAASGAASVTVSSIPSGSALWLAGNDWDRAVSRTLLAGDVSVHQNLPSVGDTYWVEDQASAASGTQTVGTSAPATDQWNAVAVAIPPAVTQQPPGAPTGLTAGTTTASTVPLSWTAPSGTVTGYYVYRNSVKVATVTSGTSYTDTGLAASTAYTYTVSAYNGAGEGPQSSSVQATTQGITGVTYQAIDGGPSYYCSSGFTYACNAGWDSPSFFPILDDYAFYAGNSVTTFRDLNLTTDLRATSDVNMATLNANGVTAILDGLNTNFGPETVGWHIEEPDGWSGDAQAVTNQASTFSGNLAGRVLQGSFTWNQFVYPFTTPCGNTMQDVMTCTSGMPEGRHLDIPTADIWWFACSTQSFCQTYVGPNVLGTSGNSTPDQLARGSSYGDMVDAMRGWVTAHPAPVAPYIETEDALAGTGSREITPPEFNWAAWSTIVHGARMLLYFGTTSNFGSGSTFGFSQSVLPGQSVSMYAQAKATNGLVKNLAPIINSQFALHYASVTPAAYVFPVKAQALGTGIDIMAKDYTGSTFTNSSGTFTPGYYIFASSRGSESQSNTQATFTVAGGFTGTVTVVGENRTVQAVNGVFSDTFATGSAVHIYKVG